METEKEGRAISASDKAAIKSELKNLSMKDLVATHRRLHQFAAQGNLLSGFTKADMEWLHGATEDELVRRAKEEDREPPEPSPLEWGSRSDDELSEAEVEDDRHLPSTVKKIIAKAKKGSSSLKLEDLLNYRSMIERRYFAEEMRVEAEGVIEGYAAVFNQWSDDLGGFRERIRLGAFRKTLMEADIRALFNHDPNYVLGRNKAKTLELEEDSRGLQFKVKPPETQWAKDLQESIRRKDINQASFGFRTTTDQWYTSDRNNPRRELIEVQLFDVSVVTYPAYSQTNVSARSLAEMFLASIQRQSDPETMHYLREQIDQIEAAEPELEPHSEEEAEQAETQVRQALRKRNLEIEGLLKNQSTIDEHS